MAGVPGRDGDAGGVQKGGDAVSACKVCGKDTGHRATLCEVHDVEFTGSPEFVRWSDTSLGFDASAAALVDFITRARAERQNGGKP